MRFRHVRRHVHRDDSEHSTRSVHASPYADLGDEAEAFLAGRLVEHLRAQDRAVPPWAALNRLAHGTFEELGSLVETDAGPSAVAGDRGWVRPWAMSERILAFRVLSNLPGREEVRRVQRTALVPLELGLIMQSKGDAITVHDVFDAASDTLDRHLLGR